jgi:multidrug resistance efflux pump
VLGLVSEVRVQEGDYVSAGTVLLRMEDTRPRKAVDEARAALDVARTEFEEGRRSLLEEHRILIELAQSAIRAAQAQLKMAEEDLAHKQERLREKLISAHDVTIAEQQRTTAAEVVRGKEEELKRLKLKDPNAAVTLLRLKVEIAEARLEQARAALADYVVTAPRSGTVLQVSVRAGEALTGVPRQAAIEFAPDSPRVIRAEVQQAFAYSVTEGLEATIVDDAHAPGTWTGRVTQVSDWFTQKQPSVGEPLQFSDVRVMPFLIELDPGQSNLRLRQRVLVILKVPAR